MIAGTYGKTEKQEINVSYGTETEILQKKYSQIRRTFSQIFRHDQTIEY